MPYFWKGNLCGRICEDCTEPLSNLVIRVYRPADVDVDITASFNKALIRVLKESEVQAKSKRLLASALIDEAGNFSLELDDDIGAGPFEVDILAKNVPGQKEQQESPPPRQMTLGPIQPDWEQSSDGIFAYLEYCISARIWCAFRALFDAWVICGRVVACSDRSRPIGGLRVIACDTDILQDDRLGEAITDASGHFRIDYTSADFKRTLLSGLSSIFDIETPAPPFNTGPDVYFRIETNDGTPTVLLEEARAAGRQPGRENVANCLCVSLCAKVELPDPEDLDQPTVWTQIGNAFTIPAGGFLNDFTANGFGVIDPNDGVLGDEVEYAFYSRLRLLGGAPRYSNGHPVEYRFRISDTTTPNNGPAPAEIDFSRIVGRTNAENVFVESTAGAYKLGQMIRFSPTYRVVNVFAERDDLDPQGWLDVNQCILRTFTDEASLNPADLNLPGVWQWKSADFLMGIDTTKLTTAADVPPGVVTTGQGVPSANTISQQAIAIRFEAREVIDKANNNFVPLPGSGQTLNMMVINNNKVVRQVAVSQHLSGNSCDALSGNVDVAYSLYHPYLLSAGLHLRSNNFAVNTGLTDSGRIPLPDPTPDEVFNPNLPITSLLTEKCTYILRL
ncbi:MAG: hypothetical protein AAF206_25970, partial [Bacteroidota bacterium]